MKFYPTALRKLNINVTTPQQIRHHWFVFASPRYAETPSRPAMPSDAGPEALDDEGDDSCGCMIVGKMNMEMTIPGHPLVEVASIRFDQCRYFIELGIGEGSSRGFDLCQRVCQDLADGFVVAGK